MMYYNVMSQICNAHKIECCNVCEVQEYNCYYMQTNSK